VVISVVTAMALFSIVFIILYNKYSDVSYPIPSGLASIRENPNVLGSETANRVVFYNNNGVKLGTSLNENLKPQIDITVDDKTTSKILPTLTGTTTAIGDVVAALVNSWTKIIDFFSTILDKFIS
jgi:hypothetical protein